MHLLGWASVHLRLAVKAGVPERELGYQQHFRIFTTCTSVPRAGLSTLPLMPRPSPHGLRAPSGGPSPGTQIQKEGLGTGSGERIPTGLGQGLTLSLVPRCGRVQLWTASMPQLHRLQQHLGVLQVPLPPWLGAGSWVPQWPQEHSVQRYQTERTRTLHPCKHRPTP